ncbi:MAG: hypothetical protein MUF60_11580, partial [Vicinamibacterales bacterium]|nr:hypothetical protein [Vicinamibacterales bacterium]
MPFAPRRASAATSPLLSLAIAIVAVVSSGLALSGTTVRAPLPSGTLVAAPELRLPSPHAGSSMPADSNSPAVWSLVRGAPVLQVLTSIDGYPSRTTGDSLEALAPSTPVDWRGAAPPGGVWMEAVITDAGGVWYGYYHNEVPPADCPESTKIEPRIGAARSYDRGRSWRDLGIVLAAPPGTATCGTRNRYFAGGVGDFS